MSRKKIRKLLSAAMGLLALGSGTSSAKDEKPSRSNASSATAETGMNDGDYLDTRSQTEIDTGDSETEVQSEFDGNDIDFDEESVEPDIDPDIYDQGFVDDVRGQMNNCRQNISRISSKLTDLTNKWNISLGKSGGAALQNSNDTINKSIKYANKLKEDFDRRYDDFARIIAANPSSEELFRVVDASNEIMRKFDVAVKQLEDNMIAYESDLQDVKASDKVVDQQKRKVNTNLILSKREVVAKHLKTVRQLIKSKQFNDIDNYKEQVDVLSVKLSDVRARIDAKGEDGISNDEYDSILVELGNIDKSLDDIQRTVKNASDFYNQKTDHVLLTETLLKLESMWNKFRRECNPKQVLASGMRKTSVARCQMCYDAVKNAYVILRKNFEEKINSALKDTSSFDKNTETFCNKAKSDFNFKIMNSRRSFDSIRNSEAARQKQLSPAEYRQRARADFVNECRSIRERGELTTAEKVDELVDAMSKVLPGREAFHRQMLNVLLRDVQIDGDGNVDSTSVLAKNTLLIGSPGNGKTEEARVAAEALGVKIVYARGEDFATESAATNFFENLKNETLNANGRFMIFFDEIDSILLNREDIVWDAAGNVVQSDANNPRGAVPVFNGFISDMLLKTPQLMKNYAGMVATTNLAPRRLDKALVSRFQNQIRVPRFDESAARRFLTTELEPISITADTTKEALVAKLANIMASNDMDARQTLNLIDEVWGYAKSNMNTTSSVDEDDSLGDDDSTEVIIEPRDLIAAFNGMQFGGNAATKPSTPVKS